MRNIVQRGVLVVGLMGLVAPLVCTDQSDVKLASETTQSFDKFIKDNPLESVFRKNESYSLRVPLDNKDVEVLVGGNMKIDGYFVRNGVRLDKTVDDQINQFRQRMELGVQASYGKDSHNGQALVESKFVLGNTMLWRSVLDKSYAQVSAPVDQDFINPPVHVFAQEAWLSLNLGQLSPVFDTMPTTIKAGYFPFVVGRGIALGDRSYGGITYLGFPRQGVQTYMPKYAPGILIHSELPGNNMSIDAYYSPLVAENITRAVQTAYRSQRIADQGGKKNAHGRYIGAISLAYWFEPTAGTRLRMEPYVVYYNSDRQTLEGPSDSPMRLMTFGSMIDAKIGPVKCNLELATQYGQQDVLPWINVIDNSTSEFHPGYKIKLGGSMFMFDMAYEVKDYPVVATAALAYFSGGDYPYNDTPAQFHAGEGGFATILQAQQATSGKKDREFKGFMPLRDWGYRGMWCNPLIMFSAGVVPRPVDVDINKLTTFNDADCASNLMFLGLGATWYPLQERKALAVSGASFFHWEARPPLKWSVSAPLPGGGGDALSVYNNGAGLGVTGWHTTDRASSFLGTEFNMVVDYKIAQDCELSIRGGIFFPAQLYADVAGQPNERSGESNNVFTYAASGVATQAVVAKNPGLGRSMAYGLYTRVGYSF